METIQILILKAFIALLVASNPGTSDVQKQEAINQALTTVQQAQVYLDSVPTSTIPIATSTPPTDPVSTSTPPDGEQIFGSASVVKDISLQIDRKIGQYQGVVYSIRAYYTEDGRKMLDVPITLRVDDNPTYFAVNGKKAETNSAQGMTVKNIGDDGGPGVWFTYSPELEGDRTLTFEAGGITSIKILSGQLPKDKWPK